MTWKATERAVARRLGGRRTSHRNLGVGDADVHDKQALVLVNRGGAKGRDVLELMLAVQRDVREQFGVELLPEPVVV